MGILLAAALCGAGTARADELNIDIQLGCAEAFRILPGPMMLHDPTVADYLLDELGESIQAVDKMLKSDSVRHYGLTESAIYFELIEDLHDLYGLSHP